LPLGLNVTERSREEDNFPLILSIKLFVIKLKLHFNIDEGLKYDNSKIIKYIIYIH